MGAALMEHWPKIIMILGSLGLGGMLKTLLDYRRAMRKQSDEVAMELVAQLTKRIETVEAANAAVVANAAQERALCDANLSVLRHRVNNLSGDIDGLLLLIEMAPEKAGEFVARIKERRAAQALAEAAEKAAVTAAAVQVAAAKGTS